jgi:uncharacterized protein YndB with AHSA1/START domain
MTTPTTPAVEPIVREITVAAPREHAFETFINMTAWWPLVTHTIGKAPARASIIQTRVGGRWYGIDADGDSHEIGHVLVYEPPSRIVLSWEISHDFTYDPTLQSEVEITFDEVSPAITRVMLEHRKLEVYGEHAAGAREIFNSEGGWGMLLERFGAFAEKTAD